MKIYFTASVTSGRKYLSQYKLIVSLLKKLKHQVLSTDVAEEKLNINGSRLNKDQNLSAEEIFRRERAEIDEATLVIAEVTQPSMGVGMLVGYALQKKKPVLALLYKEAENNISAILKGHPSQNLFLEHYSEDNLKIVLQKFFHHIEINNKRKGRLIVIDGSDASGKKTQADLLLNYLQKHKYQTRYIDFPRYYSSFHGKTVARYLAGEFGGMDQVNPYLASLAYALDRLAAKEDMEAWLFERNIVVSNRYVSSSMAFQTARVVPKERNKFLDWIYEMEYKEHKLPLEDIVIYLNVPVEISQKLMERRGGRKYLKGQNRDIHEKNIEYLTEVERIYLDLVKKNKHWVTINCLKKGKVLRSKTDIHHEILNILQSRKIIL